MVIFLNYSGKEHTHIFLKLGPFFIFYCVLPSGSLASVDNFFLELITLFQFSHLWAFFLSLSCWLVFLCLSCRSGLPKGSHRPASFLPFTIHQSSAPLWVYLHTCRRLRIPKPSSSTETKPLCAMHTSACPTEQNSTPHLNLPPPHTGTCLLLRALSQLVIPLSVLLCKSESLGFIQDYFLSPFPYLFNSLTQTANSDKDLGTSPESQIVVLFACAFPEKL